MRKYYCRFDELAEVETSGCGSCTEQNLEVHTFSSVLVSTLCITFPPRLCEKALDTGRRIIFSFSTIGPNSVLC